MGAVIPQIVTETKASGAQIIDGSLKFDKSKTQYLTRTPSSAGNRRTFTISFWRKGQTPSANETILHAGPTLSGDSGYWDARIITNGKFGTTSGSNGFAQTTALHRDIGWYHVVIATDTNQASGNQHKIYVNGALQSLSQDYNASNVDTAINQSGVLHHIGSRLYSGGSQDSYLDSYISQYYFIDGLALGPEYFGFTDRLTNTWRPKKFKAEGTTYNDGTVWSSGSTVTGGTLSGATYGFDGSLSASNYCDLQATDTSTTANVTFAVNFKNVTKVEVFVHSASSSGDTRGTCETPNGVTFTSPTLTNASQSFHTIYEGEPITLKNIGWGVNQNGATGTVSDGFRAFRINGEILIDSTTRNLAFGTNGFYLPMDGNSPIGQDKSGNGNDWTPRNFGGSNSVDKATGALPILNTLPGGTQAGVGVFGSKQNVGYAVTYYDDGGGNKYYIDGVKQATLTGLIRGATYTFDTVALGSTHPFRLSATSAHGTEYTNGVVAVTGTATTITIPYDAPETLYYYCTAHSGMGGNITGITTNEKLADQYASNCTLALPLVDGDDDVCASIACTANNKTPTNTSVNASTTQSNFYSGSHYWSANSATLQYAEQGAELEFGTGDFTIECWVYDDDGHDGTSSRCYIFDNRIGGSQVGDPPQLTGYVDSHNEFNFGFTDGTISYTVPSTVGKWWHFAATREGTTTRLFIDGILRGSGTSSTNFTNNGIGVGRATDANYGWSGYIQDFRVYNGVAKYTSNFIPASTSPDILPDTPSGVSGGSKLTKITDGAVAFDGTGDYLSLAGSSDLDFGTGNFTLEGFFYKNSTTLLQTLLCSENYYVAGNDGNWILRISSANQIAFATYDGTSNEEYSEFTAPNGVGGWHHFALVREGTGTNQTKFYFDGKLAGSMTVSKSLTDAGTNGLRIGEESDSGPGNNFMNGFLSNIRIIKGTALYTSNFTPPTAPLTNVTNTKLLCCQSNTSATEAAVFPGTITNGTGYTGNTSAITVTSASLNGGSDTNIVDGDLSTVAEIRGAGSFVQMVFPQQQNGELQVYVGNGNDVGDDDIRVFIDGVEGTSFDTSGTDNPPSPVWHTIHTGNFTTVKLEHQGSTTGYIYGFRIGTSGDTIINASGGITANGDAAATNFNPFNTDINTVRGQETGYTTWNPLDIQGLDSGNLKDGNLSITHSAADWLAVRANKFVSSGKWYYEVKVGNNQYTSFGVGSVDYKINPTANDWLNVANVYGFYPYNGKVYDAATGRAYATADTSAAGNVYGIAIDMDNKSLRFYENGRDLGVAFDSTTATNFVNKESVAPMAWLYNQSGTDEYNFGQKPFKFPPPDGFQPLNAANVRLETVISRPDQYVGITTWKGDDQASHIINDLNFDGVPDFVWIKRTDGASVAHQLYDTIRGETKPLVSSASSAEDTQSTGLIDFVRNGFELGSSSVVNGLDGDNSNVPFNYVAWCWKAGGNKNTFNIDDVGYANASAAGLDGGSIAVTGASVGTKQGFSIIKYTGTGTAGTISHGLLEQPKFVIIKDLKNANAWAIQHVGTTLGTGLLKFNTDDVDSSVAAAVWNSTAPTSSVFSVGTSGDVNYTTNSAEYIAYLWHDVPGLQKFGVYEGNASTDGTFVELGFKPALLWRKGIDNNSRGWYIVDNKRDKYNPTDTFLDATDNDPDGTGTAVDFLSNGFKLRNADAGTNYSETYIYCAWAEAPTINLYGGQSNAR